MRWEHLLQISTVDLKVIARDPLIVELTIPPELPDFEGHFPGNPILPAVGIVELSLWLARRFELLDAKSLSGMGQAKFLEPIRPGMRVRIDYAPADPGAVDVRWTVVTGEAAGRKSSEFDLRVG